MELTQWWIKRRIKTRYWKCCQEQKAPLNPCCCVAAAIVPERVVPVLASTAVAGPLLYSTMPLLLHCSPRLVVVAVLRSERSLHRVILRSMEKIGLSLSLIYMSIFAFYYLDRDLWLEKKTLVLKLVQKVVQFTWCEPFICGSSGLLYIFTKKTFILWTVSDAVRFKKCTVHFGWTAVFLPRPTSNTTLLGPKIHPGCLGRQLLFTSDKLLNNKPKILYYNINMISIMF